MISLATVFIFTAGAMPAGMAAFMVMIALYIRIKYKFALQQSFHTGIRTAHHTGIQFNTGLSQRHTCAAADSSAVSVYPWCS